MHFGLQSSETTLQRNSTARHLAFWLATPNIQQAACLFASTNHARCKIGPRLSNMLNITKLLLEHSQSPKVFFRIILRVIPLIVGGELEFSWGARTTYFSWIITVILHLGCWTNPVINVTASTLSPYKYTHSEGFCFLCSKAYFRNLYTKGITFLIALKLLSTKFEGILCFRIVEKSSLHW